MIILNHPVNISKDKIRHLSSSNKMKFPHTELFAPPPNINVIDIIILFLFSFVLPVLAVSVVLLSHKSVLGNMYSTLI